MTINEIAKICNVSRGTVDRVINNRPNVNPTTRKRVQHIINKFEYQTPTMKKSLVTGPKIIIGFVIFSWTDKYFPTKIYEGINSAKSFINNYDFEIITKQMKNTSTEEHLRILNEFEAEGVNAIITNAPNHKDIIHKIDTLQQKNIPVVLIDSDIENSKRLFFVGQDLSKSGQIAAGLISKFLSENDKVLIVAGDLMFSSANARVSGFINHLHKLGFNESNYVVKECFEKYDLTNQTVYNSIKQDKRIKCVYMANESVSGCVDAINRIKLPYRIRIVCNDLTPHAKKYLMKNAIDFIIGQSFVQKSYQSIVLLYRYLKTNNMPKNTNMLLKSSIITKELLNDDFM